MSGLILRCRILLAAGIGGRGILVVKGIREEEEEG